MIYILLNRLQQHNMSLFPPPPKENGKTDRYGCSYTTHVFAGFMILTYSNTIPRFSNSLRFSGSDITICSPFAPITLPILHLPFQQQYLKQLLLKYQDQNNRANLVGYIQEAITAVQLPTNKAAAVTSLRTQAVHQIGRAHV